MAARLETDSCERDVHRWWQPHFSKKSWGKK